MHSVFALSCVCALPLCFALLLLACRETHIPCAPEQQHACTADCPTAHSSITTTPQQTKQKRILVVEDAGSVYAVSNKCSHLGLPLQGKTAMFTATVRGARRRAWGGRRRGDGGVGGGWCWIGGRENALGWQSDGGRRGHQEADQGARIPTMHTHTTPITTQTNHKKQQIKDGCVVCPAHNTAFSLKDGAVKGEWCPKFPQLPLVGKLGDAKPLPTFGCRVSEAGDVEVDV